MTAAAPAPAAPQHISIRTTLLALALVPVVAMGAVWLHATTTTDAANHRALVLTSARQLTSSFAIRLLDLTQTSGGSLDDRDIRATAQERTQELIETSRVPITNIAVYTRDLATATAFARGQKSTTATDLANVTRWKQADSAVTAAMNTLAKRNFEDLNLSRSGFAGQIRSDGRTLTLVSSTIPGGDGVVVATVDTAYVQGQVRRSVQRNLLLISVVTLITLGAGSVIAERLIRRIRALNDAAQQVSGGDMDTRVKITGNDEVSDLGRSIDAIRESLREDFERIALP